MIISFIESFSMSF